MPAGPTGTTAARSCSACFVWSGLILTHSCEDVDGGSCANAATRFLASVLFCSETASSRSMITASAPDANALAIIFGLSPGTNNQDRGIMKNLPTLGFNHHAADFLMRAVRRH